MNRIALMISDRLDAWLPAPSIRTHHRRAAAATPDRLWTCARGVRLADTRTLGHLVRWRIPGTGADSTFDQLLRGYPFTVLEESEHLLVSGLCGRIWTLARDYPRLDETVDFRDWNEPGTVRVLIAHWTQSHVNGRTEIVSEARVAPVDRGAARRLRALWIVVGPFDQLVGAEGLTVAVRRAENR
jgi:hypothetical protein